MSHYSITPLHAALLLGIFDLALFGFFEFGGVSKCFVYDFAFAACEFGLSVFYDEYAVMLSAAHWSC